MTPEERGEHRQQSNRRNWIEAKFGEGKRRYGLGLVMAKTRQTSENWIAMVIFVINAAQQWRDLFLSLFLVSVKALKNQGEWSDEKCRLFLGRFLRFLPFCVRCRLIEDTRN